MENLTSREPTLDLTCVFVCFWLFAAQGHYRRLQRMYRRYSRPHLDADYMERKSIGGPLLRELSRGTEPSPASIFCLPLVSHF